MQETALFKVKHNIGQIY